MAALMERPGGQEVHEFISECLRRGQGTRAAEELAQPVARWGKAQREVGRGIPKAASEDLLASNSRADMPTSVYDQCAHTTRSERVDEQPHRGRSDEGRIGWRVDDGLKRAAAHMNRWRSHDRPDRVEQIGVARWDCGRQSPCLRGTHRPHGLPLTVRCLADRRSSTVLASLKRGSVASYRSVSQCMR